MGKFVLFQDPNVHPHCTHTHTHSYEWNKGFYFYIYFDYSIPYLKLSQVCDLYGNLYRLNNIIQQTVVQVTFGSTYSFKSDTYSTTHTILIYVLNSGL